MSGAASTRFDGAGWRADVVERLDRRSLGGVAVFVAVSMILQLLGPNNAGGVALHALFIVSMLMLTLAVLAVALVAIARGVPAWLAYAAAALATMAILAVLGVALDPYRFLDATPPPSWQTVVVRYWYFLALMFPFAALFAYASSASHADKILRALEAERAAEAERLAQQRLQTELSTVDHDLVLKAMRLALDAPAPEAAQAQALLEVVTDYLRAAQQRGASEPGRIAASLAELREACARRDGGPAQAATA